MTKTIPLKLNGRKLDPPALPPFLHPASRGIGGANDAFLPADYLRAVSTYDVGPTARDVVNGAKELTHATTANEVVVLELVDGSTFITSAERMRESLRISHPEFIGDDDEILIEKLQAEGTVLRGILGDALDGLIRKVFTFIVGNKPDEIIENAAKKLGAEKAKDLPLLGVSWAGTKALMWAVEQKLDQSPGKLYQWVGSSGTKADLRPVDLSSQRMPDSASKPILVFVHGTGSSTLGSFGDLRKGESSAWVTLESKFAERIYGFEHRTLSESPIENAIQLVSALPAGAYVNLVSHSRGGLVADLVCLPSLPGDLIKNYAFELEGTGAPPDPRIDVLKELRDAHAKQREDLVTLARLLAEKKLVVQRYVRTASPANGTKLASGNFDLFLSGLLSLIGAVPYLFGSPLYAAFKRVVIEIAKNRTDPHLVPGIEAMLPDSPMARLLHDAKPAPGIAMSVIAGDIEGGNLLKRLGVLLTDFLLFENTDNDSVVDTRAMLTGIAPALEARVLFDRGADVSHFKYFVNYDTRTALSRWLCDDKPEKLTQFRELPSAEEYAQILANAISRDAITADKPVVVVLPGVMGTHLTLRGRDRVWLDPGAIASGGLEKIAWGMVGVEAEELFGLFYGALCKELSNSHVVRRFPYDWRQPLDVLGERLGEFLDGLLKQTTQPIRIIAHSMGGLVVRACIAKRRGVMDALMVREGARLVMCGTPHQGAYSMVENLIGKGDTLRMLVRLDAKHDMQEVLDLVAGFPGPLQLLPKPGFSDTFQGQPGGGEPHDYSKAETWTELAGKVRDFWFGDGKCSRPAQEVLDAASWLWMSDGLDKPRLPAEYEKKSIYVFGVASNTPCGVREENGRLKMVGTTRGDGTVTWDSGYIDGIGSFYYLPARHGDLLATSSCFGGLIDLLTSGATTRLSTSPPALRAMEQPVPIVYDAGPPILVDDVALLRGVMGASAEAHQPSRTKRRLEVSVKAMDLRFLCDPIMVGHYELDPISGPEELIDRELLDGDLSERHSLGLYAGPRGTAVVVLRPPNGFQPLRGAIVTGLGNYDVPLTVAQLTEAVRVGALRYLLQVVDVLGEGEREVSLSTLLLGYNSSANLSIAASVEALVRGVMEANARFRESTHLNIHIGCLNIIELYLDTAITAVYGLRQAGIRLAGDAETLGISLAVRDKLEQNEGARQRLFDSQGGNYWPRLMVTDADHSEDECGYDVRATSTKFDGRLVRPDTPLASLDGSGGRPDTQIANRVRFLFVGQRARSESIVQQRQPDLVEKIVGQQIHLDTWSEDLGRMLFQLMVPHDFKDAARQLERVVLVVDSYTANLPWELMLADDSSSDNTEKLPLSLRTPMVRQLSSLRYRRLVRQSIARNALVVGNPSVNNFGKNFIGADGKPLADPPGLPGAETEARAVQFVLEGMRYKVTPAIDRDSASDVLAKLFRNAYRIVHISAHGVFDLKHKDGRLRSGVVLSDGLLITAAEIQAMESVPELVFLNCCHLAKVEVFGSDRNKLAASIARELIDIGVRCVVVAGWAVNDEKARLFAQIFYDELLRQGKTFGDAVFAARKMLWDSEIGNHSITWGAFQAYGDPAWRAEPRLDGIVLNDGELYASPNELLDDLARARTDFARKREHQSKREATQQIEAIEQKLNKRSPPSWLVLPHVQSALGSTWKEVGRFEKARDAYLTAIRSEDKLGYVPIRDIEQLANVEARLGEKSQNIGLIDVALRRLDMLSALASEGDATNATVLNIERSALRGSAFKRKASVYAERLLSGKLDKRETEETGVALRKALSDSAAAYREAEGVPGSAIFSPYTALNRLAIEALTASSWNDGTRAQAIELAQQCRKAAAEKSANCPSIWDRIMQAESLLVERMIDGTLGAANAKGDAALEEVSLAYELALVNVTIKPSELDSLVSQMKLLSRFDRALGVAKGDDAKLRIAYRLLDLIQRIQPGSISAADIAAYKVIKTARATSVNSLKIAVKSTKPHSQRKDDKENDVP